MGRSLLVYADGGSRGNPGVAGYGAIVLDAATGDLLAERAEPLGLASNNVAEYSGLIAGLRAAAALDPGADIEARMDSKLVVEQMAGRWKIKHEDMRRLALEAREVAQSIAAAGGSVEYVWVPREKNTLADRLSNVAMDGESVERDLWREGAQASDPAVRHVAARVVLVGDLGETPTTAQLHRVADAVGALVSGAPARIIASSDAGADAVATLIADRVGSVAEVDEAFDARDDQRGSDGFGARVERVSAAYHRVVGRGGLAVVVLRREPLRCVLAHLLDLTEEASARLAVAPGALHGIEIWDDGSVSVAFTNRT